MWDTESMSRRLRQLMVMLGSLYAWAGKKDLPGHRKAFFPLVDGEGNKKYGGMLEPAGGEQMWAW